MNSPIVDGGPPIISGTGPGCEMGSRFRRCCSGCRTSARPRGGGTGWRRCWPCAHRRGWRARSVATRPRATRDACRMSTLQRREHRGSASAGLHPAVAGDDPPGDHAGRLAGECAAVPAGLGLEPRQVRDAADHAVAAGNLADVAVHAEGAAIVDGVLLFDPGADHRVPAPALAADPGLHRRSVGVGFSAAPVQLQPADLRDGQPAVPDAHVVGDGEGGCRVAVFPPGVAPAPLQEGLPGVGLVLEGVADGVPGIRPEPRFPVPQGLEGLAEGEERGRFDGAARRVGVSQLPRFLDLVPRETAGAGGAEQPLRGVQASGQEAERDIAMRDMLLHRGLLFGSGHGTGGQDRAVPILLPHIRHNVNLTALTHISTACKPQLWVDTYVVPPNNASVPIRPAQHPNSSTNHSPKARACRYPRPLNQRQVESCSTPSTCNRYPLRLKCPVPDTQPADQTTMRVGSSQVYNAFPLHDVSARGCRTESFRDRACFHVNAPGSPCFLRHEQKVTSCRGARPIGTIPQIRISASVVPFAFGAKGLRRTGLFCQCRRTATGGVLGMHGTRVDVQQSCETGGPAGLGDARPALRTKHRQNNNGTNGVVAAPGVRSRSVGRCLSRTNPGERMVLSCMRATRGMHVFFGIAARAIVRAGRQDRGHHEPGRGTSLRLHRHVEPANSVGLSTQFREQVRRYPPRPAIRLTCAGMSEFAWK